MYKIQKGEIATFIAIITLIGITVLTFITASTTSNITQKETTKAKAALICDGTPVQECGSGLSYYPSYDACCSTSRQCIGYSDWDPDLGALCYDSNYPDSEETSCCGEIDSCPSYAYTRCEESGYTYDESQGCCRTVEDPVDPSIDTNTCTGNGICMPGSCSSYNRNDLSNIYSCGTDNDNVCCDSVVNEDVDPYTPDTNNIDTCTSNGGSCLTSPCANYGKTDLSYAYSCGNNNDEYCCSGIASEDSIPDIYCDDPAWCFYYTDTCPSEYAPAGKTCSSVVSGEGVCCKNKTYVDDTTSNFPADTCNGQCEDGACNTLTGMTYGVGQCFNSANPYCCIAENVTDNRQLDSTENTCYSGVCVYSSCEYNNMVSEPGNCGGGYSCCIGKETETMNDLRQFEANNVACDSGDCWVGWEYCDSPDSTGWTQSGTCKVSGNSGVCCVEKATQGMGDLKTYESNNISCDSGNCYVSLSECDDNYYTQTGVCKDGGNDGVCCVEKATQGMGDLKADESQTTGSEPCEYLGGECKADWSTLYNSEYEKNPKGGSCSSEIFSGWGQSCYRLISAATEETNSTKEKTCQELGGDECRANLPGWNSEYVKISDGGCGSFGDLYQSCYRKLTEGEVAPTEESCTGDSKECIYDTLGGQPIGYTKISNTGCGTLGNFVQSCYQKVNTTSLEEATTGRNCQQIEGAICSDDLLGDGPIGYTKTENTGCDLLSFPKQACYIPKSATENNASEGGACVKSGGKCMVPSEIDETKYKLKTDIDCSDIDMSGGTLCYEQIGAITSEGGACVKSGGKCMVPTEIDETKYKLKTDVDCSDIDMSGGTLCYEQIGAITADKKPCADLEGGKCMVSSEIDVTKFKPLEGGDCTEVGEGMSCYGPIGTTGGQGTLLINGMLYDGPFTFSTGTITFSNIPNTYTKENPAIVNIDVSEKEVVVDDVNDLGYRINFNEPYENLNTNQEATVFSGE